jgi:hypothetical protein
MKFSSLANRSTSWLLTCANKPVPSGPGWVRQPGQPHNQLATLALQAGMTRAGEFALEPLLHRDP